MVVGELTCKNVIKIKYGFNDFHIKSVYRSHVSLKKLYDMYKISVVTDYKSKNMESIKRKY